MNAQATSQGLRSKEFMASVAAKSWKLAAESENWLQLGLGITGKTSGMEEANFNASLRSDKKWGLKDQDFVCLSPNFRSELEESQTLEGLSASSSTDWPAAAVSSGGSVEATFGNFPLNPGRSSLRSETKRQSSNILAQQGQEWINGEGQRCFDFLACANTTSKAPQDRLSHESSCTQIGSDSITAVSPEAYRYLINDQYRPSSNRLSELSSSLQPPDRDQSDSLGKISFDSLQYGLGIPVSDQAGNTNLIQSYSEHPALSRQTYHNRPVVGLLMLPQEDPISFSCRTSKGLLDRYHQTARMGQSYASQIDKKAATEEESGYKPIRKISEIKIASHSERPLQMTLDHPFDEYTELRGTFAVGNHPFQSSQEDLEMAILRRTRYTAQINQALMCSKDHYEQSPGGMFGASTTIPGSITSCSESPIDAAVKISEPTQCRESAEFPPTKEITEPVQPRNAPACESFSSSRIERQVLACKSACSENLKLRVDPTPSRPGLWFLLQASDNQPRNAEQWALS